jgi:hypothetical protein
MFSRPKAAPVWFQGVLQARQHRSTDGMGQGGQPDDRHSLNRRQPRISGDLKAGGLASRQSVGARI